MKTTLYTILLFLLLLSDGNAVHSNKSQELVSTAEVIPQQKAENDPQKNAEFHYKKGMVLYDEADYLAAQNEFLLVLEQLEDTSEREILASSLYYLGNIESWKSDYSQAILYHKKSRDLFNSMNNLENIATLNIRIASSFYTLGEYDSTITYFKNNIENSVANNLDETTPSVFQILPFIKKKESNRGNDNIYAAIIESYQGLATLYSQLHNYKEAYNYLQRGIKYAEEIGGSFSLAKLYFTTGNLLHNNRISGTAALEYLQKAKTIFREENTRTYLSLTNLSIGKVYFDRGNDSLAMQYFVNVTQNASSRNFPALSQANHMIGMVLLSRNQYDSALVYLQKSIDVMCPVCPEIGIHNSLLQTADIHLKMGNTQKAFDYLTRAKHIAVESNSGLEIVKSYKALAGYYRTIHKPVDYKNYLTMAHNKSIDLGLLEEIKYTAESLSKIYYSDKQFQTASDYLKLANVMSDSLASIERYNEIAKLETRFEIEKIEEEKKLEARLMQSEVARQKLIRNSFFAVAILLVIISLIIFSAYRRKKKDNKLLSKQKSDIEEISRQLQEAGKRKLDFFTNIAHEIRTPLTLIKTPLERILKSANNNEDTDTQLQTVLSNTNKLKGLVNQILDLQKLDEKLLGLDLSEFEIISLCRDIVASFEGYCRQSKCRFTLKSNVSKATVNFDKIRLEAIINNLLSNAFKFNKTDGFVGFTLEVEKQQMTIKIEDSGIGISDEHLKKLGERYFQIEGSMSAGGTGIGFAYAKELVNLMKGSLEIFSKENEGTSIIISLPCDSIDIQDQKPLLKEIIPKEDILRDLEQRISENPHNGQPSILIIEDNLELGLFLRDLFSPSCHVYYAKDGVEGKEMAFQHIPDLIISDVMIPGLKGNELCKILKNDVNTSHITIILFTAKGSPESIDDGYDCGADDYIVKPFDTDLLLKKVKNILSTVENARKQFSFSNMERSTASYSEFDKKFLQNCVSVIKENLHNSSFTVEQLAEKVGVHKRTLSRKFTALTGKSAADLLRHNRMSQAAEFIKQKYRVNEIALMVGYEDANRFSKAFKQFHGVSPSAYK